MINTPPTASEVAEVLGWIPSAPDYDTWVRTVSAVGNTLPDAEAEAVLLAWSPDQKPGETRRKLRSRMTRVRYGSLIEIARRHGFDPKARYRSRGTVRRHYATSRPSPIPMPPPAPKPRKSAITGHDAAVWAEGCDYLLNQPDQAAQIDTWRGYPRGTTTELAQSGLIASCLLRGQRAVAFPVIDHTGLQIGFHARHEPKQGERATWSYHPTGTPALPFVLGAGFAPSARRVVVTEGQWDAIALAASMGWLAHDTAFDEATVIFGTRGTSGTGPLLTEWMNEIPAGVEWLLFRDADKSGLNAFTKLTAELTSNGHTVTLRHPAAGKDVNEALSNCVVTWEEVMS